MNILFENESKFKDKIGIYSIKNLINKKVYIGQTLNSFYKRFLLHQWKLKNNCHDNKYLQNSYNKYKDENFIFSVVEFFDEKDVEKINEREKYWINYYRELKLSYNLQDGGQDRNFNRFISLESRKKIGEINRERMIGTKLSSETKNKMSTTRKGKYIKRKNNLLNLDQVYKIKKFLIDGLTPKEIMSILGIEYKAINHILSSNSYAYVKVDGWEEFQNSRKKKKGVPSVNKKYNSLEKEDLEIVYNKYLELKSLRKTAEFFNKSVGFVSYRIDLYKKRHVNPVPSLNENQGRCNDYPLRSNQ